MTIRSLFFSLAAGGAAWAAPQPSPSAAPQPAPVAAPAGLDGLGDADVAGAITAIKGKFFDSSKVDDPSIQRALLQGLLDRLTPGVVLVDASAPAPRPAAALVSEILASHIGYLRLGSVDANVLLPLDAALKHFNGKKVDAVIVDLRGMAESHDFNAAADVARRFCPKGKVLFTIQKPSAKQEHTFFCNEAPAFHGVVVVLTDAMTEGAAEALAATLRQNDAAMIIGAPTQGGAAEFVEVPLAHGSVLRVAIAQIMIPGLGPIFPAGVKPDIFAQLPPDVQKQIFQQSKEKGVSEFVFETDRPRMNEAALVANLNPEIDSAQAYIRDKGRTPLLHDTVLQRAVDLVTAIDFYKSIKQ